MNLTTQLLKNAVANSPYTGILLTATKITAKANGVNATFDSIEEFIHTYAQEGGKTHETQDNTVSTDEGRERMEALRYLEPAYRYIRREGKEI